MKLPGRAAAIVYPHRCCVCGELQSGPCTVCERCAKLRLTDTAGARCPVCGLRHKECVCADRLCYETLTFPFFYDGDVRTALRRLKFRQRTDLVAPFAKEMADAARRRGTDAAAQLICFIPMRRFARWKRGYNQAEMLAKELGRLLEKPVLPLLVKQKTARTQHALSAVERRGNLLGAFEPDPGLEAQIEGKRILLVDDICTTGSTLNEAAKTLMIFGAERVDCLCAAARPRKKPAENKKNEL